MKARTKFQKEIVELSGKLPKLTYDQLAYAREELFKHKATRLKSGRLTCLDCGHIWQDTDKSALGNAILGVDCPSCHRHLEVENTRKKVFSDRNYYQVIDTFKGYQVIRMFEIGKYWNAGQPQNFWHCKIYENWISKKGETAVVGLYLTSKWNECWGGSFELRSHRSATNYTIHLNEKYVYPKKKFIPILKRNGMRRSFHGINPHKLMFSLLKDPKVETLFKAKQYDVLRSGIDLEKYWPQLKICLRNNYIIPNSNDWVDYLRLLEFFGKDIRNKKYVCPEDLHKEHNRYVERKRKYELAKSIREKAKELKEQQKLYQKSKAKWFGLSFSSGKFEISFINSTKQMMEEGNLLHHCIYSMSYFKRKTLLFSVRKSGEVYATTEIDPEDKKVLQLRKVHNTNLPPEDHERVMQLIMEHMNQICNPKPKKKKRARVIQKRELEVAC